MNHRGLKKEVELVGVEPTSRQSLQKLSTRLAPLGFSSYGRCGANRIVTLSTVFSRCLQVANSQPARFDDAQVLNLRAGVRGAGCESLCD